MIPLSKWRTPVARSWPALALVVGGALAWLGSTPRPPAEAAAAGPVVAVLLPGTAPAGLEALGLLDRLRKPLTPGMAWLGGDLIEIPGARGIQLWRRAVTGRIDPDAQALDLLAREQIPVYGEWDATPDAARDRALLAEAAAHLEPGAAGGPAAIVLLSCPSPVSALNAGPCRNAYLDAVQLLERAASRGGTGLLLAVPVQGFPQVGTVWVIGENVQQGVDFRFRMIDVAPTILRLLDRPALPVIDGSPAYDMMRFEHLFHHPLRWVGGGS